MSGSRLETALRESPHVSGKGTLKKVCAVQAGIEAVPSAPVSAQTVPEPDNLPAPPATSMVGDSSAREANRRHSGVCYGCTPTIANITWSNMVPSQWPPGYQVPGVLVRLALSCPLVITVKLASSWQQHMVPLCALNW